MRKKISLLLISIIILVINGCKKDEIEEAPKIACPIFVLNGPEFMQHEVGEPWIEPGFLCSEYEIGENDLANSVIVDDSDLDINTKGVYTISYTATNSLDCVNTVYRTVFVTQDCGGLFDLQGEYNRNFGTITMNISQNEDFNVFDVEYIYNFNDNIISGKIADLCDFDYTILRSHFGTVNNKDIYMEGYAFFDLSYGVNGCITFYISTYFYEDDSHYADYQITWYKS